VDVAASIGDAVQLLDFPTSVDPGIDARYRFVADAAIRLTWKPVAGASGSRVPVARDLAFVAVEQTLDVAGTEATFTPRGEGVYAWRVATRDGAGRLGEYGFARRIYCEHEAPRDLLVGPNDGAVVRFADAPPPVAFTWQSSGESQSYRLVVTRGRDFAAEPVVSRVTAEQRVEIAGLAAGEYVWGVYLDDKKPPVPLFVRPRTLVVQKVAKPKVKVPSSIGSWGSE
jgi:hypothetical protein